MSSTRNNARHVRQRKLNTKQGLRIIRESEIEEQHDESQQHIPQVETGVEKGEEIEYHLQAVINASNAAALGAKQIKQNYIPTPEATRAKGVQYDELYPKVFKEPATYIRFSSTVEDCNPIAYCMNEDDAEFLAKLNDGKDVDGRDRKGADKLSQCSEDCFEEVMNFFEETSARLQPFANVDNAPILSLEEMERSAQEQDEPGLSAQAQKWSKPIYKYWVSKKGNRALMPAIKVRVLDTASEVDDADPYVCFRRREVRQTRKTRGRDAQVAEKIKKLRCEMEDALNLVRSIRQRENMKEESLKADRNVFDNRRKLKEVKIAKGIIGEKGDDEVLLVNQKPTIKTSKSRQDSTARPATIRIRSGPGAGDRAASTAGPENDLPLLEDFRAEAEAFVSTTIEARKQQHENWNKHWFDETKYPITPPVEESDPMLKWASFPPEDLQGMYPTPPPSLPSQSSLDQGGDDVEIQDAPPLPIIKIEADASAGAETPYSPEIFHIPGAYPPSDEEEEEEEIHYENPNPSSKRSSMPACRLRYGRGGRMWLETRKRRPRGQLCSGVVSDDDSDDDYGPEYFPVPEEVTFNYRAALNNRPTGRPEGAGSEQRQRQWVSPSATAGTGGGGHGHPAQASAGGGGS